MVVDDFHVRRTSGGPPKTDPKLIVDPNAVLPGPISLQRLQAVSRRHAEIAERIRNFELTKFSPGDTGDRAEPGDPISACEAGRIPVTERYDHASIISPDDNNVNQDELRSVEFPPPPFPGAGVHCQPMFGAPLHFATLVVLLAWLRFRPRMSFRRLMTLWWTGIVLSRIAPPLLSDALARAFGAESIFAGQLMAAVYWVGAVCILRACFGLANWERPWRKRTRFAAAMAILAALISAGKEVAGVPLMSTLGAFFLFSARWRMQLGASGLIFAAFTGLVSFFLSTLSFSERNGLQSIPTEGAHASLTGMAQGVGMIYGAVALFAASTRIHLSIRRVGRRLVVSHLLAGVVPVVVSALFLLLAGSLYLSTYRGQIGHRYLSTLSRDAGETIVRGLEREGQPPAQVFPFPAARQSLLILREGNPIEIRGAAIPFSPEALLSVSDRTPEVPLVWDRQSLYLRARVDTEQNGRPVRYEALARIDSVDIARIASFVGTPIQIAPGMIVRRHKGGIQLSGEDDADSLLTTRSKLDSLASRQPVSLSAEELAQREREAEIRRLDDLSELLEDRADSLEELEGDAALEGKRLAAQSESLAGEVERLRDERPRRRTSLGPSVTESGHLPGGTVVPCLRLREGEFTAGEVPVLANASLAEIVTALFTVARENPLATVALIALAFLAVLLGGAIAIATNMVATMVRSVTRAVTVLKEATAAIGEGRLDHRIKVEGQDELWSVASSFNEMAAGLERVRSMELQNQRLEQELALAREIQHRLLPAAPPNVPEFDIAGISISAREVGGDYFDYLYLEDGLIGIAVADVSGKGAAAALLMSSFRASLRSYDLASLGPAETLSRLNKFVHGSVTPGKFITAFLGVLNPVTGDLRYSCAGHEPPIVVSSDGSTEMLSAGGLVLGLFPNATYEEATSKLPKDSLLAVFTDGVTEAQSPDGEFYGDTRLMAALLDDRGVASKPLLDKFVRTLKDFAGGAAQFDDITMVLARRK